MIVSKICGLWSLFTKDPAVRYSLLSRVVGLGLGPLLILFVGAFLSPAEQGVYYVFGSLLQLRAFVDLGFSQSAQQMLAHAFGDLSISREKGITGDPERIALFLPTARLIFRVYHLMGFGILVLLSMAGNYYLEANIHGEAIHWQWPWWVLVVSLAFGIFFQGIPTVIDAANLLHLSNKWRFIAELAGVISFLIVLQSGGGLWASAALSWSRSLILTVPLALSLGIPLFRQIRKAVPGTVRFRRDILPLQSRNMVSWGMGFLVFYSYNLISLSINGAVIAGVIGMSLQIANLIQGFSTIWFNTKIPRMGNLAGLSDREELYSLHYQGIKITLLSWCAVATGCLVGAWFTKLFSPGFGNRFASIPELLLFLLGTGGHVWIHTKAAFIRAHRIEPFALLALVQAVATVVLLWILLPRFGTMGAAVCFVTTMTFGAVWVEIVYRSYLTRFSTLKNIFTFHEL